MVLLLIASALVVMVSSLIAVAFAVVPTLLILISIVARSRSGITVIVDESALGCATGTVTDCTRFCVNDIVPVSWLQQQLC